jgi:N-acetylglucosamine malate deacetylase 1
VADVLAIVAHPDDESLFAGGTLARLARNGAAVHVLALSDGVTSRVVTQEGDESRRRRHFAEACQVLGVTYEAWNVFPDQQSDTVPQLLINREVELALHNHQPRMIFTHHVGDLNLDHRRVAEAVLVATRVLNAHVYSMAPEWPSRCIGPAWTPDVEWDITDTLEAKLAACACYVDEMRAYPHPRSSQALRQTSEYFMEIR